jgi:hypothetical protein
MAVSSTKSEILTCWDKNQESYFDKKNRESLFNKKNPESYFDKKKTLRDVDKFPVNFSVVPHIVSPLENIFGYLDFKDLNNCRIVCKIWQNILHEKRSLWIELLEKEKIKKFGSSSENCNSLGSDEIWQNHIDQHDPNNVVAELPRTLYAEIR